MIGVDTTFLVQLELVELPAHKAPQVPLALVVPTSPCQAGSRRGGRGLYRGRLPV